MTSAVLTISSKNYSSWSLRGWLLCKMSGLEFAESQVSVDDASSRAELLLLSPSFVVPSLDHDGIRIWDTLSIAEYLHEIRPDAGLYPSLLGTRAHCRSISGEMHGGFQNLRSALPMNLRAHFPGFKVWAGAQPDIARIQEIWRSSLNSYGGPYLCGPTLTVADAVFAPVCTRFQTYDVAMDAVCTAYCERILAWPALQEWTTAALAESLDVEELDVEF